MHVDDESEKQTEKESELKAQEEKIGGFHEEKTQRQKLSEVIEQLQRTTLRSSSCLLLNELHTH